MSQLGASLSSSAILAEPQMAETLDPEADNYAANPQLHSVMSELNRLSRSFMDSYQNLEGQVEKLNDQLQNETEQKIHAIHETKQLINEKALLTDRLQNLLAVMPAGVVVIDGEGRVKDCNAKAVDLLGRPLLGELWITVIRRAFKPQADDGHQISLKDGRKIHIETRALDVEPGQLVVLTDLTKTFELQAELSQQQKLSSMGKMIASLAHQIRTPLSAAILYGSHLKKGNLDSQLTKEFSGHLLERLHFMERQINDMLSFVRGERKEKTLGSMNGLVAQIKTMTQAFPDFVTVKWQALPDQAGQLLMDQDALIGAVLNLIENACDACEQSEPPCVEVGFRIEPGLRGENRLAISVTDNGKGIAKNAQRKIFEPFYTSKPSGNGLGLAVVHGTVVEHGGKIRVESSEKNHTTQFEILLPLVKVACFQLEKIGPVTKISPKQEKINEC